MNMNNKYRILSKKLFESTSKFEERMNEECRKGWKPTSISSDNGSVIVLMEKTN